MSFTPKIGGRYVIGGVGAGTISDKMPDTIRGEYSILAADDKKTFVVSAASIVIRLPLVSTISSGWKVRLVVNKDVVFVFPNNTDFIGGVGVYWLSTKWEFYYMNTGSFIEVTFDGSNFYGEGFGDVFGTSE